jgi:AbrB family looped-hinge helix DNA binding protein
MYDSVQADSSETTDIRRVMVSVPRGDKRVQLCPPMGEKTSCCRVVSLVSVDERGQMVLPKEIRERAKIHAGDKLALVSWERDGSICCLSLVKADELTEMIKSMLGPVVKGILG